MHPYGVAGAPFPGLVRQRNQLGEPGVRRSGSQRDRGLDLLDVEIGHHRSLRHGWCSRLRSWILVGDAISPLVEEPVALPDVAQAVPSGLINVLVLLDPVTLSLQPRDGLLVSQRTDPVTGVLLGQRLAVHPNTVSADQVSHRLAIRTMDGDVIVRHGPHSLI